MPVVFTQSGGGGHASTSHSVQQRTGPNAHLGLSIFVLLLVNPPFGLVAVIFSALSRSVSARDWDTARLRGKIALFLDIAGIVSSVIIVIIVVLIFFTKDT